MRHDSPRIPIKNIYYMLCYSWNVLEQSDNVLLGSEKFDNIYNLLSKIYINGVNSLIKRGFSRYYILENESSSIIKGKINVSESIKKQTIHRANMICQYDDFSQNIKLNQIVKTTINMLIKAPQLDLNLKNKLIKLRLAFTDIDEVRLSREIFASLRYNKNNYHYRMLVNISQLLYQGLITNEEEDNIQFADFVRDSQMAKLFEKFILNFYKMHLDEKVYTVHSPKINWNLDGEVSEEEISLLPEMRTDIVIENKMTNTQLIIDTKYYVKTLVTSNWGDIEKVRTGHLYQILAYVDNSKFEGDIKGLLLYPTVEKEINAKFPIGGKNVGIRTLNLDDEWCNIVNRLIEIVL